MIKQYSKKLYIYLSISAFLCWNCAGNVNIKNNGPENKTDLIKNKTTYLIKNGCNYVCNNPKSALAIGALSAAALGIYCLIKPQSELVIHTMANIEVNRCKGDTFARQLETNKSIQSDLKKRNLESCFVQERANNKKLVIQDPYVKNNYFKHETLYNDSRKDEDGNNLTKLETYIRKSPGSTSKSTVWSETKIVNNKKVVIDNILVTVERKKNGIIHVYINYHANVNYDSRMLFAYGGGLERCIIESLQKLGIKKEEVDNLTFGCDSNIFIENEPKKYRKELAENVFKALPQMKYFKEPLKNAIYESSKMKCKFSFSAGPLEYKCKMIHNISKRYKLSGKDVGEIKNTIFKNDKEPSKELPYGYKPHIKILFEKEKLKKDFLDQINNLKISNYMKKLIISSYKKVFESKINFLEQKEDAFRLLNFTEEEQDAFELINYLHQLVSMCDDAGNHIDHTMEFSQYPIKVKTTISEDVIQTDDYVKHFDNEDEAYDMIDRYTFFYEILENYEGPAPYRKYFINFKPSELDPSQKVASTIKSHDHHKIKIQIEYKYPSIINKLAKLARKNMTFN